MVVKAFRYYEIIPPSGYKTAIDGQPSVELYVGTEETARLTSVLGGQALDIPFSTFTQTKVYVRPEDIVLPDYELVYVTLRDNKYSVIVINPLAVISDLQTDEGGNFAKRLRALFYKQESKPPYRKYPMLFEVDALPFGYSIAVANRERFYATDTDLCSPYHLREHYTVVRIDKRQGQRGKTLQLISATCFKHRLEVPIMIRQ
jgi:hypothetical protein